MKYILKTLLVLVVAVIMTLYSGSSVVADKGKGRFNGTHPDGPGEHNLTGPFPPHGGGPRFNETGPKPPCNGTDGFNRTRPAGWPMKAGGRPRRAAQRL